MLFHGAPRADDRRGGPDGPQRRRALRTLLGCFAEFRHLHFNVCYYAPIEYCLREGLSRFEPGAGGEFKHLRGFEARPTGSMHFIAEPRLARAIKEYLGRERAAIAEEISWWDERSELKASRDRVESA